MQTKFWKLHTPSPLPQSISCISPPTYYTSTRFGIPFGPFFNLALNKNRSSIGSSSMISNDRMETDESSQNDIKSRISPSHVTVDFNQSISTISQSMESSLLMNLSQMMIPLQPRKNLGSNGSTNKSFETNPMKSNLSEYKVLICLSSY